MNKPERQQTNMEIRTPHTKCLRYTINMRLYVFIKYQNSDWFADGKYLNTCIYTLDIVIIDGLALSAASQIYIQYSEVYYVFMFRCVYFAVVPWQQLRRCSLRSADIIYNNNNHNILRTSTIITFAPNRQLTFATTQIDFCVLFWSICQAQIINTFAAKWKQFHYSRFKR